MDISAQVEMMEKTGTGSRFDERPNETKRLVMKKLLRKLMIASCLLVLPVLLTQCASSDGTASSNAWPGIYGDDPMYQQIRMQEQMSQVTRSLIPF